MDIIANIIDYTKICEPAKRLRVMATMAALFMVAGCVADVNSLRFNEITPQSIAACARAYDHPLEVSVKFDTQTCYKYSLASRSDNFVRAHKSKATGITTYHIYVILQMKDWYFPKTANFKINGELMQRDGKRVSHDIGGCSKYGCVTVEHFVFSLTEAEIKMIIENTDDINDVKNPDVRIFSYYIKGKTTQGIERHLNVAEIEGLYNYVTAYDVTQKAKAN